MGSYFANAAAAATFACGVVNGDNVLIAVGITVYIATRIQSYFWRNK